MADAEVAKLILDSATEFAIFTFDDNRVITSWNRGAQNIFGWTASEMVGARADRIFTPEDVDAGAPDLEMSAARTYGRAEDERWHLRADGERIWVNGLMMPLTQGERLLGYLKILRDRTAQRLATEHARESETMFRLLADEAPVILYLTDETGARTYLSRRWYDHTGQTVEDGLLYGWFADSDLIPPPVPE